MPVLATVCCLDCSRVPFHGLASPQPAPALLSQDIKSRASRKQTLLNEAATTRRNTNSARRVEQELFNGLRRDKVDSIQKMQVRRARGGGAWRRAWGWAAKRSSFPASDQPDARRPPPPPPPHPTPPHPTPPHPTPPHPTPPHPTPPQAYQRQLLLEKIMEENEKTARLLEQRQAIQEQRKAANMTASMHRNKVGAGRGGAGRGGAGRGAGGVDKGSSGASTGWGLGGLGAAPAP
jgi:hypothetical protein